MGALVAGESVGFVISMVIILFFLAVMLLMGGH